MLFELFQKLIYSDQLPRSHVWWAGHIFYDLSLKRLCILVRDNKGLFV